jgi:phage gp36-like protein
MSYATVADFLARVPHAEAVRLTNQDAADATTPNEVRIETGLNDSFNEMNGYLRAGGYEIPQLVSAPPADLKLWQIIITRYHLNSYTYEDDPRYRDYLMAVDWLKQVAARRVILPTPDPTPGDDTTLTTTIAFEVNPPRGSYEEVYKAWL